MYRMRLTLPHYFDFGTDAAVLAGALDTPEAWDALRVATSGPFAIAHDRAELERQADARPEIGERAERILAHAGESLASYGAGAGLLELWLLRLRPGLDLAVTDYGTATVERLRTLLPEARTVQHDLLHDDPLGGRTHLFHRIDTELSNRQWRGVLRRFRSERVVFVPGGLKSDEEMKEVLRLAYRQLRATRQLGGQRAGRIRTAAALEGLWSRTHHGSRIRFHDLDGWVLSPAARSETTGQSRGS